MKPEQAVIADGMKIEWDVPIPMSDGVVLRADVFRPIADGNYPVVLSHGPYAKGLSFQEGFKGNWDRMVAAFPEIMEGTTNKYQNWELVDPEKWVPDGYVCVRIDSRGSGRSPGFLDVWSPRETQDLYECVEWSGVQPWSNGKVGINGISYYAMNQWHVAALQPPHLAAICVWEGAHDYYREFSRHGGILCRFLTSWFNRQVARVQHGVGDNGFRSPTTGETVAGPPTLSKEELEKNRVDPGIEILARPLEDDYYRSRTADLSKVVTPLLSSANWGGMGLHPRGNFEGYLGAASKEKWLEVHGDSHFSPFYRNSGVELQKQFLGYYLKGEKNGWTDRPKVEIHVRHPGETFVARAENEWPLARTRWTKFYLTPDRGFGTAAASGAAITYETMGEGVTFSTPPLGEEVEITGPVAAKLFVSSDTTDADIFLALRVYDPAGKEVLFIGSNDPQVPVGLGWLRASHRKLDPAKTKPYRPWHSHDELQPLEPGKPVELDVEVWNTSIVVPKGYGIAVTVKGNDYDHGLGAAAVANAMYPMKGVGPFLHDIPEDRPPAIFGGKNTLHFEAGKEPYLLLPVIPG
ncbi:CocE/NonD family hydrolase [Aquabacter sp. CN5-332]|uniref:CocE/NonD family hydrolase n=1 Tax=Aquabacter sp. CN5-332 TaxID=3156608 RepID=UPI0032B541E2